MTQWKIEFSDRARRDLRKFDRQIRDRLIKFIKDLQTLPNPRSIGKVLSGPLGLYWCYRMGDYRIICNIRDNVLVIEIIRLGHRREIYKQF